MTKLKSMFLATALAVAPAIAIGTAAPAKAESVQQLNQNAREALHHLVSTNKTAAKLDEKARAVLVFPNIVKAGLVFGGAYGEGELLKNGKVEGYYNSVTGTWGLQAGAQSYSLVLFLMTKDAVSYLHKSAGWELGAGPTVAVVSKGAATKYTTSTLQDDVYAFIFNQQGLMAGVTIQGTKISRIHPSS